MELQATQTEMRDRNSPRNSGRLNLPAGFDDVGNFVCPASPGVRYVGLYKANIQAGLPQLLLNPLSAFGSARGERDACSGLSEELRRGLADSGTSARNQSHFPV